MNCKELENENTLSQPNEEDLDGNEKNNNIIEIKR